MHRPIASILALAFAVAVSGGCASFATPRPQPVLGPVDHVRALSAFDAAARVFTSFDAAFKLKMEGRSYFGSLSTEGGDRIWIRVRRPWSFGTLMELVCKGELVEVFLPGEQRLIRCQAEVLPTNLGIPLGDLIGMLRSLPGSASGRLSHRLRGGDWVVETFDRGRPLGRYVLDGETLVLRSIVSPPRGKGPAMQLHLGDHVALPDGSFPQIMELRRRGEKGAPTLQLELQRITASPDHRKDRFQLNIPPDTEVVELRIPSG